MTDPVAPGQRRAAAAALLLPTLLLAAVGCGSVYVDPAEAGPDFQVQGEYRGDRMGAQVVALGDGRFAAIFLAGGLPGSGWDGKSRVAVAGERVGDETVFRGQYEATLRGAVLRGATDGGEAFTLRKTQRESSTLGAPPPSGATVLFDGRGPGGFDGKVVEGDLLKAGATTRDAFQSFKLHMEFRIPFMPTYRGQQRGNSGVYLQNRYEIQLLDSFGLEEADDECGAIYAQKAPDVNMSFPPLSWQTYDIVFDAARFGAGGERTKRAEVSVRHNGVLIHDRIPIETYSDDGDPEGPAPGAIHFQDLWIPVVFRNVWIVERGD